MTWIAVGVAGTQAAIGGAQYFANKKRIAKEEANRVKYKIPDEVYQNLNQAQQQALQGLPEEQKQQYLSNLQRSSSYALGQAGTRKAGLAGVSAINEQQNVGYGNMLAQDAAARMQNQQQLMGQRANVADYKNMAFSQEKNAQDVYNAKVNANVGALTQNLMGAAGSIAGIKIPKKEVVTTPPAAAAQQAVSQGLSPYGNSVGSFINGGQNMFQQPQANPYQAPPLQFGNTPYSGQGYNPWTANTQPFHIKPQY